MSGGGCILVGSGWWWMVVGCGIVYSDPFYIDSKSLVKLSIAPPLFQN